MSASIQHGGNAFEKSGAAPPVVIAMPDDESHFGADDKIKKEARLTKYAKGLNYFRIVKYLVFLLAMIGIIVLAIQVNKGKSCCHPQKFVHHNTNPNARSSSRSGRDPEAQPRDGHCTSCAQCGSSGSHWRSHVVSGRLQWHGK